tara:strand:- start:120 stop:515 length:396 start_codon:yes stop_codon:yes gene_type:complete
MSIYKIDLGNNNIYVGSTKNPLSLRRNSHKHALRHNNNKKLYNFMRDNDITDFELELVEAFEGDLKKREEYHRKKLNANLNSIRCYITEEERLSHKNKKITCSCGCVVRYDNITRHRKTSKHLNPGIYIEV